MCLAFGGDHANQLPKDNYLLVSCSSWRHFLVLSRKSFPNYPSTATKSSKATASFHLLPKLQGVRCISVNSCFLFQRLSGITGVRYNGFCNPSYKPLQGISGRYHCKRTARWSASRARNFGYETEASWLSSKWGPCCKGICWLERKDMHREVCGFPVLNTST